MCSHVLKTPDLYKTSSQILWFLTHWLLSTCYPYQWSSPCHLRLGKRPSSHTGAGQNGRCFADTFIRICLNENVTIFIGVLAKCVPKGPINNILALIDIMAWRRPGHKPLSEIMMVRLSTHICVTRPQLVKDTSSQARSGSTRDLKHVYGRAFVIKMWNPYGYTPSLITRFMGPTWGHLGPTGPRWAPCWPCELCYLGWFGQASTWGHLCNDVLASELFY